MAISNKVVKRYIVKRDLKSLFPKEFTGRELIGKFFDYVMNNFFEKSYERYINGYIGKKTSTLEEGNFYITEKDAERQLYQLTPMLIDKNVSNDIQDVIDYSNFINTLKLQNCHTNDHNRLLSNEHWSYCPPIDVDMFLNYNFYYWVEGGIKTIEIKKQIKNNKEINTNVITDILGKSEYIYRYYDENENIKELPFNNGMRIIFRNDDNEEYNNKIFIVEGVSDKIILVDDSEIFNPYKETEPEYFVMDRGCKDGNPWSLRNRWFHINNIKLANAYNNIEDTFENYIQAKKPILCFNRDIELFNFGNYDRGWVKLITDKQKSELEGQITTNDYIIFDNVKLKNNDKILFTNEPLEENNNKIYELFLIDDNNGNNIATLYNVVNGKDINGNPVEGESIRVIDNKNMYYHYNEGMWTLSQQKNELCQSPLFNLYDINGISLNNHDFYVESSFKGNTLFNYKLNTNKNDNIDENLKRRIIVSEYGNYIFENTIKTEKYMYRDGNNFEEITGMKFYKINGTDKLLNDWHLSEDVLTQYVLTEITVTDDRKYFTYTDDKNLVVNYEVFDLAYNPSISNYKKNSFVYVNGNQLEKGEDFGLGTYVIKDKKLYISLNTGLKNNDSIYVKLLIDYVDELADGYVFDLPLMLTSNALNEDVTEIKYNEMFDQLESILENQQGFDGLINGINNYKDTKKDLSLGTSIVQHSTPIVKTMLLNNKEYTNVRNVMTYIGNEYTKFKNKFLTILDNMVDNGEYLPYDRNWVETNPLSIVVKIINKLNIGKEGLAPFYNNGVAEQLINLDETSDYYLQQPYIPSTPAYLGLDNCYKPRIIEKDDTLTNNVLLCHDGSYESASNDYRDKARLELEMQIYNSINDDFKDGLPSIIKQKYIPGKFRKTEYSYDDYMEIYIPIFEKWCIQNGLNYEVNNTYDENDPFTWNWSGCIDKNDNSEILQGSYRGIYMYYYDTYEPNTKPWEMLGLGSKPSWWEEHYGTAPYTSENIPMWRDIENGYIADGISKGYYECFKREGLIEKYLPVDSEGNLLNPIEAGIIDESKLPTTSSIRKPWKIGDIGHIENVWLRTSEYRYGIQTILYLMKPVEWIEKTWDSQDNEILFKGTNYEQIINVNSKERNNQTDIILHNELIDGEYVKKIGSQQWFSDFLVSQTVNITDYIGNYLRNMDIQLGYRCGGFFDKDTIRVMSDNYGLIPENNYHLKLSEKKLSDVYSYSAMLITKYDNMWMLDGYDYENPYFKILTPKKESKKTPIEVNGRTFTYYNIYNTEPVSIKYKTIFTSAQELYNVICGYGKYLESQGFVFNLLNENGEQIDYVSEAKKFLLWYQISEVENGTILQLNPMGYQVNLNHEGFANKIGSYFNGFWSVVNPNPSPIYNNDLDVYRHTGYVKISAKNDKIANVKITTSEKENILLFDNETIYGNILYNSLKGIKTSRFKLLGIKSNGWNGTYYAPGYLFNTNETISPSYDKLADDFNYIFDTDDVRSFTKMGDEAKAIIGYHKTNYMENLLIDNRNMFNFYKGMLKEKGTRLSFNKLNRSTHIMSEGSSKLNLDEHWAFNVGQFGYTKNKSTIELLINADKVSHDPQIVTFSTNKNYVSNNESTIDIKWDDDEWLKRNENIDENTFKYKDTNKKLPTGGFAQLDDCDYILDTHQRLEDNLDNIEVGKKVWIVKDNDYTWNMYKKIDDELNPLKSLKVLDMKGLLSYNTINLNKGDLIYVENDILDNWVSRLTDDETADTLNLFINDVNHLINNPNYNVKKVGWSVYNYSGIVPYSYVVTMPNGIVNVENNLVEYTMHVCKGLTLNMPNGKDDDGNNLYYQYVVPEDKLVNPYMEDIEYDGNFTTKYGKFTGNVKTSCTVDESLRSFCYVIMIECEKGLYPIIFKKDSGINSFENPGVFNTTKYGLFMSKEKFGDKKLYDKINSVTWVASNQNYGTKRYWLPTYGWDSPDLLQWDSVSGSNANNISYPYAKDSGFNYGYEIPVPNNNEYTHPTITVDPRRFNVELIPDSNGKKLKITYMAGEDCADEYELILEQYNENIEPKLEVYNYLFVDDKSNIYKVKNFYESIEEPNDPEENDFWYNTETNIISRYNGLFWENANKELFAWGGIDISGEEDSESYCSFDRIPYYKDNKGSVLYKHDMEFDTYELVNVDEILHQDKMYCWFYGGNYCYSKRENPIPGDILYSYNQETKKYIEIPACIVSSYYEGADYLYCDTTRYIREKSKDNEECILVKESGSQAYTEYVKRDDLDVYFNHYSKIADVSISINENDYSLTNISVPNPYELKRIEQKQIDIDLIDSVKLIDNNTDKTLSTLSFYDPLHCILPEKYVKEIDYITSYDPVNYNNPNQWYNNLGKLWWDTSKVRYLEYYQGDLKYRRDNWGKQLPGSEISIMEWTKSTILPDDAEKYLTQEVFNPKTNKIDVFYYFWVMNPSSIPEYDFRTTSAYDISRKINSPQDEGMIWFAPINLVNDVYDNSSFVIGNFDDVTTSQDFVVQINFKNKNDVENHNEWLMIVEDSDDDIPDLLWNKMKYSLIGEMSYIDDGEKVIANVPDMSLPERERYGISIRPLQTMFKNLIKGRRNFVDAVNSVLSSRDVRYSSSDNFSVFSIKDESYNDYDISYIFDSHLDMNKNNDKSLIGKYVLVKNDEYYENIWTLWKMIKINNYELVSYQKYDMGRYSYYIDAFLNKNYTKDTYNKRIYASTNNEELIKLIYQGIPNGYIVRIDDPETKDWEYLLQYNSSSMTFTIVGIANGYIQISDKLYTYMEDINDNIFIDGRTYYDYINEEVKKIIEIICDYFYKN